MKRTCPISPSLNHLTQRLTVLTSTYFTSPSALLYSHQHTSPHPAPYCTHINTMITTNGLHSSANFSWRNSITARCLNRTSEKLFHWDVHCASTASICVCSSWSMMEERYHATTQNRFYPDMSNVNKNITGEAKFISSLTYMVIFCLQTVQGEVWWKRDTMRLHRTGFIQICLM